MVSDFKKLNSKDTLSLLKSVPYKNIIFDLNGVLFKIKKRVFLKEIGYLKVLAYSMMHLKSPFYILEDILAFMNKVNPPLSEQTFAKYYNKDFFPSLLCNLQQGYISYREALAVVEKLFIQNEKNTFFASIMEKNIIAKAIKTLFTPEVFINKGFIPSNKGVRMLRSCYKNNIITNNNKKLYLLANCDCKMFSILSEKYKDIFSMFDGTMISAEAHSMKPEKIIFKTFLNKYGLDSKDCFFIDDQEENISAAFEIGMSGSIFCPK
jgi:FMN phosphatase YigB (HAD superfamily)